MDHLKLVREIKYARITGSDIADIASIGTPWVSVEHLEEHPSFYAADGEAGCEEYRDSPEGD